MDCTKLEKELTAAVAAGVTPYPGFPFEDSQYSANVDEQAATRLTQILEAVPECAARFGQMLDVGTGGVAFLAPDLARWLMAHGAAHGAAATIQQLASFLAAPSLEVEVAAGLNGIEVESPIDLGMGVTLAPTPASTPRAFRHTVAPWITLGSEPPPPTMTSVLRTRIRLSEPFSDPMRPSRIADEYITAQKRLYSAAQGLMLVGPHACVVVATWNEPLTWVPLAGKVYGSGQHIHEILPRRTHKLSRSDDVAIVTAYAGLAEGPRRKLEVPINRLNLALRRRSHTDTAIELGIALEALLANDRPPDAPIGYVLRLRGAVLASEPETRRNRLRLLGQVYALRSKAVHGVSIEGPEAEQTLTAGCILCAEIIRQIVALGSFPSWPDVELGIANL